MRILIAPDKFKGSLTALEVCEAIGNGLEKGGGKTNEIIFHPMADGGDGSLAVLDFYFNLNTITKTVQDPLGRPIEASYKMQASTAYIEMATASGLVLLNPEERNCMYTSSFGTGELIADALEKGAREVYLFVGGSATNDGGIGIATALGYQFLDSFNNVLSPIGKNLLLIDKIDSSQCKINFKELSFNVVCDVNNPFSGPNGAAHVYAAQKGASPKDLNLLDQGLKTLEQKLIVHEFQDISQAVGAGAAGGVGGGAIAFLGAKLLSGIQTFSRITNLETKLKLSDLIITGEGKLDLQTEQGKVISGVCELAKKYQKPLIAICGDADLPISENLKINKLYTIRSRSLSLDDAMHNASEKLQEIGIDIISDFNKSQSV